MPAKNQNRKFMLRTLFSLILLLTISACASDNGLQSFGNAVLATADQQAWQTIFPGGETSCSDNSPYSFHVKPGGNSKLLIFLNGGGACWNTQTCDYREGNNTFVPRADIPQNDPRQMRGIFDLENPNNFMANWNMLFVSYCTGDVHLGSATRNYIASDGYEFQIHHHGANNANAALNWAVENIAADEIVVAGSSAGAVASPVYAEVVANLYPEAELLQYAGGASGFRSPVITSIMSQWNVSASIPDQQYPQLNFSQANFYDLYSVRVANAERIRHTQFDTVDDQVQKDFRYLVGNTGPLINDLRNTYTQLEEAEVDIAYFLAPGDYHTILRYDVFYQEGIGNISFLEWFRALVEGRNPDSVDFLESQ